MSVLPNGGGSGSMSAVVLLKCDYVCIKSSFLLMVCFILFMCLCCCCNQVRSFWWWVGGKIVKTVGVLLL